MSFSLIENAKIVQVGVPADRGASPGAALTTEWISMKNARKCTFIYETGTLTSTSNQAVTLYVANNASGTKNKAITSAGAAATLTLPHYYVKTASTDTYVKTTVSSSAFNITKSSGSKVFVIEVDAARMGTFIASSVTYNAEYVRVNVATPGVHGCLSSCIAVLTGLRYQEDSPPSAIT